MTITSSDLLREVRSEFLKTYRESAGPSPRLQTLMRLGVPSTKRTERFGYYESLPTLERWDRGESIPEDGFLARSYSVENLAWGKALKWHEEDAEDIQLSSMVERARMLASRAALLPAQVGFQILTGGTDAALLKAIPNAPDGAALFATTAGGANRFGVSSGNLLTGNGVATAADLRTDFWAALEQFVLFQDTEGQPLIPEEVVDQGVTIVYGVANKEAFHEAFKQERTLEIVQNVAANENVAAAAVSNTVRESSIPVTLWGTQRITDNDWFVVLNSDAVPRPMFQQVRQPLRTVLEDRSNSERARDQKYFRFLADLRHGYGVNLPYGAIKVNN